MNSSIKKIFTVLSVTAICISISACGKNSKKNIMNGNEGRSDILVVESDPERDYSYIVSMDDNLKNISEERVDMRGIARGFKDIAQDDNYVYINGDGDGLSDEKYLRKIIRYSKDSKKIDYIDTGIYKPDTISVDEDNIYLTTNSPGKLNAVDKNSGKVRRVDMGKYDLSSYTEVIDGKLYMAVRSESDSGERSTRIDVVDTKSLGVEKSIKLDKDDNSSINAIVYDSNHIYFGGTLESSIKKGGCVFIYDRSNETYKPIYTDYSVVNIFITGDKLVVFSCDSDDANNVKARVEVIDRYTGKIQKQIDLDTNFYLTEKVENGYMIIYENKVTLLDRDFEKYEDVSLRGKFNLEMLAIK